MPIGNSIFGVLLRAFMLVATVVSLTTTIAVGGVNYDTKIGLHIKAVPTGKAPSICNRADYPPCNEGEENLTVFVDSTSGTFDLYILVLDADSTEGLNAATFGITYDGATGSGIDVLSWTHCASIEFDSDTWPAAGSGNIITWDACQNTAAQGDSTGGVTAVLGAMTIALYGADVFEITRHTQLQRAPELAVAGCSTGLDHLPYPRNAGTASFGTQIGYDPCKGPYSPYSDFEAMAQSDLDSLQVKLTYAGAQRGGWRRAKKSIVFVPSGQTVDMSLFDRLKRPRIRYYNDDYAVEVTASLSELKALIDSVGTLSGVTSGTVDYPSYFSFSMVNTVNDSVKGYDTHIGTSDCRDLFAKLLNGMANNSAATKEILRLGCSSDCLPTNTPTDVTDDMLVSVDGYRLDHDKNQFVTTVTVKNNGATSVDAPLILTVQVKQGPVDSTGLRNTRYSTDKHGGSCDGTTWQTWPERYSEGRIVAALA